MTVRVRFAPSPTGYLHIGGVRTALFNWLFARRHGGSFILRIDDTDAERNRPEALRPILDGFRWLGLNWDEGPEVGGAHGPYFQSERGHLYRDAAMRLLASGHAYPDYMTPEELAADKVESAVRALLRKKPDASEDDIAKEKAAAAKGERLYVHRGELRDHDPADNVRRYTGKPTTLRLKVPVGETIIVDDLICGPVRKESDELGDPVILRSNGTPLYNFASAVDDAAMGITHVIRAREHLSNTPVQIVAFRALGAELPKFAHVPVINEPNSNKKLSKRDMKKFVTTEVRAKLTLVGFDDAAIDTRDDLNPATVAFYREMGYLPAGVVNYLGRLGWSLDDKTEFIPLPEMTANFGLDRVTDAPARFDPNKLYWLAGEYMKLLPPDEQLAGCVPFLRRAGLLPAGDLPPATTATLTRVLAACGDRVKLFSDALTYAAPFLLPTPRYDAKSVEKRLKKPDVAGRLTAFRAVLAGVETWDAPTLEAALGGFCTANGLKLGDMVHPIRVATTGVEVGVGLFDVLAILGRDESLRRIDHGITLAG